MEEAEKDKLYSNIVKEFKQVVEEKADLERGIWDLMTVIYSKGERSHIKECDNNILSMLFKIMQNNKDKVKEFNLKI